jgi:hypothetical protein
MLAAVLRRQRAYLLAELRSLAEARAAAPSPVVGLLVTAAELHARADLEVVDAAERDLTEDALAALAAAQPPSGTGLSGTGTSGAPVTGQPDEVQTSGRT